MKYNKWLSVVGMFAVCMALTGCGHTHEWQEATCTTPKTCTTCDETEGEALGHTWTEATCSAPKTCSVCGETDGEALEHTLTEANYQQAATCEVCGEIVGEPLQADFEKYNFAYVTEADKEYQFVNQCNASDNLTNGKVTFSDFQTFVSDSEHEAKEGYEWRTVTATLVFDDENTFQYGVGGYSIVPGDFYDGISCLDQEEQTETDNEDFFTVNYNGIDYAECLYELEWLEIPGAVQQTWIERDDGTAYYKNAFKVFFCVPVGYDGSTISVINLENREKLEASDYSKDGYMAVWEDENTITFRLK